MSILNGKISDKVIGPVVPPFGRRLEAETMIPLPGCLSIASDEEGKYAFVVCDRGLVVYDIGKPSKPEEISSIREVRGGRDIKYSRGYVFVAAREHGLYIVDVRSPEMPDLVCIYDTLELATSVDAAGHFCFVANRHLGVEIIDITEPSRPRFVSSFLCGEAQCVHICGPFAYAGDWMNKQVYITDISDITKPHTASVFQVDGFTDGIFVQKNFCYIATGHHSARLKNRNRYDAYPYLTAEMLEEGYGAGHGLEIFDVSDPSQPEYVSSIKFPPLFGFPDLWKVTVSGERAFVSDSNNGLFVVNAEDRYHPFIEAYYQDIPAERQGFCKPQVQVRHAPITACLCLDGYLYLSGSESGIHIIQYEKSRREEHPAENICFRPLAAENIFRQEGQFHSLAFQGERIFAAAGNGGLYALDRDFRFQHKTDTCTLDVKACGGYLVCANGHQGVCVYRYTQKGFELCDNHILEEGEIPVREIASLNDRMIAVQAGLHQIVFFELSGSGKLSFLKSFTNPVMMYYRNLAPMLLKGKYLAFTSLNNGVNWYEIKGKDIVLSQEGLGKESCPIEDGIAVEKEFAIILSKGKYGVITDPHETANVTFTENRERKFRGIPFICGKTLVVLNRCNSYADFFHISDINDPVYIGTARVPYPSSVQYADGNYYICCGHYGVFCVDGQHIRDRRQ